MDEFILKDPALLTNEELVDLLPDVERIADWCKKVQDAAVDKLISGERLSGWKLIEGQSREKVSDEEGLVNALISAGYAREILYETSLKSLTDLRRAVGPKTFKELSEGFTTKPKGAPKLAKENDKGTPYINTDFDHITVGN